MTAEELLARAERERDEYQAEVHALTERVRNMTSAASMAASTTVTALERIEKMDAVLKAAQAWRKMKARHDRRYVPVAEQLAAQDALANAVDAWNAYQETWS